MVWINWSGYVPEIPNAFAFGRKQYPTYEAAMASWTGAGNDPGAAEIKWYPNPALGETEADRPGYKPPIKGATETAVENYRGYIIGKTTNGQSHLWTGENYPDVPWGTGLGLFSSLIEAERGADADIAGQLPPPAPPTQQPQTPTSKPVISDLVATPRTGVQGTIDIGWNQDIAGDYVIKVDGALITSYTGGAGYNATTLQGVAVGTHRICVNDVCTSVVVSTVEIPKLNTYELRINYYNLGWGTTERLKAVVVDIANATNTIVVPLGYTFKKQYKLDESTNTLSLYYEGHSPAVPLAVILVLIAAILIAIGFVVTALGWYKEAQAVNTMTQTKADAVTNLDKLLADGKISVSDYNKAITALQSLNELPTPAKPTDWTLVFLGIGTIVAIGALIMQARQRKG